MAKVKKKQVISRRRYLKYVLGFGSALVVSLAGIRLATRKKPSVEGYADTILMNGNVLTVDPNDSVVEAVALQGDKILAIGAFEELKYLIGPSTREVDLHGKTVTPALIDSHLHVHYYGKQFHEKLIDIRFPQVKTKDDLIKKVKERLKMAEKGEWIAGNQGFLSMYEPDPKELDEIAPDNPVYFLHASGQYAIVNKYALKLAGINKDTPDPYSGVIQKDPSTGEPTGYLFHYPAIDLVRNLIPGIALTEEEQKEVILIGARKCLEAGYTSCQDVIISSAAHVKRYIDVANEGRLPINIYMLLYVHSLKDAKEKMGVAEHYKGKNYAFGGWKIAVDGGTSAGTLLMYDRDTPASKKSYLYHTQESLNEMTTMFHKEGYQVAFHVGGDQAIDMAINAIEYALKKYPRNDHRHRLEHVLIPTPEALERIKKLGIVVSTQPQWIAFWGAPWKKNLKKEHVKRFIPLKSIIDKGIHLAFGCDVPATYVIDPKWAFIGAATRQTLPEGEALEPNERISMRDALRAHTMGSAYAAFEENIRGSIEPGKIADMIVWSENLYSTSVEKLMNLRAETTIVEGKVVYKSEDTDLEI